MNSTDIATIVTAIIVTVVVCCMVVWSTIPSKVSISKVVLLELPEATPAATPVATPAISETDRWLGLHGMTREQVPQALPPPGPAMEARQRGRPTIAHTPSNTIVRVRPNDANLARTPGYLKTAREKFGSLVRSIKRDNPTLTYHDAVDAAILKTTPMNAQVLVSGAVNPTSDRMQAVRKLLTGRYTQKKRPQNRQRN
jgi:hypothetical protein